MKIYLLLGIAIVFEVIGATLMKYADGFSNLWASGIVMASYALAVTFYILLTKKHELGTINALWSGGGTVIIAVIGITLFNEETTLAKLIGISLIIAGIYGLNSNGHRSRRVIGGE
ncbi:DMT family transporter [Guptibacillus hwajinpoensis]|nr:multidrug efflux SMR transporter [Alkalihalobacillus macyae]